MTSADLRLDLEAARTEIAQFQAGNRRLSDRYPQLQLNNSPRDCADGIGLHPQPLQLPDQGLTDRHRLDRLDGITHANSSKVDDPSTVAPTHTAEVAS